MCRKSLFKCVHTSLLQHNCMCRTRTRTEQKQNAHCRTKIAERTYIYRTPFSPLYSLEKMFSNFPIFEGLFLFSFEEIYSFQLWGNLFPPVLRKYFLSSFEEIHSFQFCGNLSGLFQFWHQQPAPCINKCQLSLMRVIRMMIIIVVVMIKMIMVYFCKVYFSKVIAQYIW